MIIVSPTLGARHWPELRQSKLYDPGFSHRFRRASLADADSNRSSDRVMHEAKPLER